MNPGWRILDLTQFCGVIRYSRGHLVVNDSETRTETSIALKQIAVVLIGTSCQISAAAIGKLADYDAALLTCDWKGVPLTGTFGWSTHSRVGARQQAQAVLSLPRKKNAWSQIVRAKLLGQSATLSALGLPKAQLIRSIASKVRSGDPNNLEAVAARVYWSSYFALSETGREPGEQASGWNSALDYGYTVLRAHGIRAVLSAGLVGSLGIFHHGRTNAFSLVDDLIEPFRPAIDYSVARYLAPDCSLGKSEKEILVTAASQAFDESGQSIPTVFAALAKDFGMYVEGDLRKLPVIPWQGPIHAEAE